MGNSVSDLGTSDIIAEKYEKYTGVSEKFAKKRNVLGWSLEKVAAMSGVSVSTLSRIERGDYKKLDVVNAAALCQAYGCSMDALFDIDVAEAPDKEPTHTAFLEKENAELKQTLAEMGETLRRVRKQKHQITVAFVIVTLLIIAWFVLVDGPNGDIGLIRYAVAIGGHSSAPAWMGMLRTML